MLTTYIGIFILKLRKQKTTESHVINIPIGYCDRF